MEPPEPFPPDRPPPPPARDVLLQLPGGIWAAGERVTAISAPVLMLLSFMGWYVGSQQGPTIAVIGWHTGVLGSLATILVLVRLISIPDSFFPEDGRGIGIWISLLAALGVIVGGLLRAGEEL